MKLAALLALSCWMPEALAWGLQTHLFFAQYTLVLLPFADPELRAAALCLPRLVLAGACVPDLALIGRVMGTPVFQRAHLWSMLRRVAAAPPSEADRALTIGYASHLLSDVMAHNVFVPQHERRFFRGAMVAHAMAEWAMDHRVRLHLACDPGDVLAESKSDLVAFICRAFSCGPGLARRALELLAGADRLLRASPLPPLCRSLVPQQGFDEHLARTKETFVSLEAAMRGGLEDWCGSDPEGGGGDEGTQGSAGEHVARIVQAQHHA